MDAAAEPVPPSQPGPSPAATSQAPAPAADPAVTAQPVPPAAAESPSRSAFKLKFKLTGSPATSPSLPHSATFGGPAEPPLASTSNAARTTSGTAMDWQPTTPASAPGTAAANNASTATPASSAQKAAKPASATATDEKKPKRSRKKPGDPPGPGKAWRKGLKGYGDHAPPVVTPDPSATAASAGIGGAQSKNIASQKGPFLNALPLELRMPPARRWRRSPLQLKLIGGRTLSLPSWQGDPHSEYSTARQKAAAQAAHVASVEGAHQASAPPAPSVDRLPSSSVGTPAVMQSPLPAVASPQQAGNSAPPLPTQGPIVAQAPA